jgi:CarD family transcriptional regulator
MTFNVGETVVYPHHGASTIEEITIRNIKGREIEYLVLRVQAGGLRIEVPSANAEYVGVRDVVSAEGLERVFDVLRQPYIEEPTNWSRRYKANVEKIASGDVIKVAEVVRDLYRRNEDRGLSAGEKRMLVKAVQILRSEVALAERLMKIVLKNSLWKFLQPNSLLSAMWMPGRCRPGIFVSQHFRTRSAHVR